MRTGGFPCRLASCGRSFQVRDQKSMDALKAASTARSDHEVADHSYHHVSLPDERTYMPHQQVRRKTTIAP